MTPAPGTRLGRYEIVAPIGPGGIGEVYRARFALQITAIGADPLSVAIWQMLLFVSILFHHSNTRLPLALERALVRIVVTPRMHGIHHSDYENETNGTHWVLDPSGFA
jgi:sterol desaturase/sphingolipid hydroxylase (fatty acid hydroxylase superfamily)